MTFTDKDIKTFQALYEKRFGIEIGEREAIAKGTALVHLLKIVFQLSASNNTQIKINNSDKTMPEK